jgi:uncharacterized protein (DUF927 family)
MCAAIPAVEPTGAAIPAMHYDRPTQRHDAAYSPSARGDDRQIQSDPYGADPFAPLTDAERALVNAAPNGGDKQGGDYDNLTMLPCPDELPAVSHYRFGNLPEPSCIWVYRTVTGDAAFVTARYDLPTADGSLKKDIRPWTYGRRVWTDRNGNLQDRTGWHCMAPPSPRPIYGLDRLAARPDTHVLVAEGEKAADAAEALFPDMVAVTSQGGSRAPDQSDWSPMRGRNVTVWPDNDQAGAHYAAKVTALAKLAGAASVRVVDVPDDWPSGWDLADPLPEGVAPERLREMVDAAPDAEPAELPDGFRMNDKGLFYDPPPREGNPEPRPVYVAAPFQIIGQTRSDTGEDWGLLIGWRDGDGQAHRWAIPRRLIHQPGNEIAAELENAGLRCGSDETAHRLLKQFVGAVKIKRRLRCVSRTGWHSGDVGSVFVLPGGEAFGPGAADVILQADHMTGNPAYRVAGTLADWQSKVAQLAVGNDRLVLFMAAAFAGPLLNILSEPSGGIHLFGDSRTGKSTAAIMAASVWGPPTSNAQIRTWRGTANGLEGVATMTSDTLLILDEMGQADAREVGDTVYMLANESGKQRAGRTGAARQRYSWKVTFLSTGELTLAQKMSEAGKQAQAGLEVRLVNLPADAGAGKGVFQSLHGREGGAAAFADELRTAAQAHHGHAARAFLHQLTQGLAGDPTGLRTTLNELRDEFVLQHVPAGATGQVRSVAGRFALIAVAGELARDYGILPWPEGEALRAVGGCFDDWLAERGGTGASEEQQAITQVQAFIEAHGTSRFEWVGKGAPEEGAPGSSRIINRVGFRRRVHGAWEYHVLPQAWRNEVCKGLNPRRVAEVLADAGHLTTGNEDRKCRYDVKRRIYGDNSIRTYLLKGTILGSVAA